MDNQTVRIAVKAESAEHRRVQAVRTAVQMALTDSRRGIRMADEPSCGTNIELLMLTRWSDTGKDEGIVVVPPRRPEEGQTGVVWCRLFQDTTGGMAHGPQSTNVAVAADEGGRFGDATVSPLAGAASVYRRNTST